MLCAKIVNDEKCKKLTIQQHQLKHIVNIFFKRAKLKRYYEFFSLFLWLGVCLYELEFVLSSKKQIVLSDEMIRCHIASPTRRPKSNIHDLPVKLFSPLQ